MMHIGVKELVERQLAINNQKHPPFASPHEAYAVLLEELEECQQEYNLATQEAGGFWENVKGDDCTEMATHLETIKTHAMLLACEAIQVAAVCQKIMTPPKKEVLIKICPECGGIVHYNSYFKAYMCLSPDCTWMKEKRKSNQSRQVKGYSLRRKAEEPEVVTAK